MKKTVLLDENLPRPLKNLFSAALEVTTVPDLSWATKKNGELLQAMTDQGIEYLLTVDKNLSHQQNLEKYQVTVIVLLTFDNRLQTIREFIPEIEEAILNAPNDARLVEVDLRPKR